MNDLHFDSVGWPQEPLPVRREPGARLVIGQDAIERAERNAKWKAANRPDYLAGKRAWYHRWKAKWSKSKSTRSTPTASATTATRRGANP